MHTIIYFRPLGWNQKGVWTKEILYEAIKNSWYIVTLYDDDKLVGGVSLLDSTSILIDFLLEKYKSEKKWTLHVIEQLSDEDITWVPTPESNSIANLVAHIWGTVHQRIETAFFNVPDTRNRDKEFDRGLLLSKGQALELITKSFDRIIEVLEKVKVKPEMLLEQPYLDMPPLTNSGVDNQATLLEILLHQFRHLPGHTGQITYIAKIRKG